MDELNQKLDNLGNDITAKFKTALDEKREKELKECKSIRRYLVITMVWSVVGISLKILSLFV